MSTNVEPTPRPRRPAWIEDAERLDLAIYAAIARTPTPALDVAMSRLSRAADYSRVHTGVHYPADVLAAGLIGTALAQLTTHLVRNWSP